MITHGGVVLLIIIRLTKFNEINRNNKQFLLGYFSVKNTKIAEFYFPYWQVKRRDLNILFTISPMGLVVVRTVSITPIYVFLIQDNIQFRFGGFFCA